MAHGALASFLTETSGGCLRDLCERGRQRCRCGSVVSMNTGAVSGDGIDGGSAGRSAGGSTPRRAEVLAALSLGLDLGLGQPMEHIVRAAVIAGRLADRLGLDADQGAVVYYSDLIAWIGCHADAPELSSVFRDEIDFRAGIYQVDMQGLSRTRFLLQHAAADRAALERGRSTLKFMISGRRRMTEILDSHYVSAGALADRLGLGARVRFAVHHTFERWDGTGLPRGVQGDDIPIEMRVVQLADVAEVHWRERGAEAAVAMARLRSGSQFDPEIVSVFDSHSSEILADIPDNDAWRAVLELAPNRIGLSPRRNSTSYLSHWVTLSISNPFSGTVIRGQSPHWRSAPRSSWVCPQTRSRSCVARLGP